MIVVGVDGSAGSLAALEWAVVRAWAGNSSLHIVHAFRWPVACDPESGTCWWGTGPLESAHHVVDDAAMRARALAPGLFVSTSVHAGGPATVILRSGERAELIVLGISHERANVWRLIPTVNQQVARKVRQRLVIVGPDDEVLV